MDMVRRSGLVCNRCGCVRGRRRCLAFLPFALFASPSRGQEAGCQLGDRVVAFFAGNDCVPELPHCWRNATVGDGPGRGDAFVTVLWEDGQRNFQRLHASYARRIKNGARCLPPYAVSTATKCTGAVGPDCSHFEDTVQDAVGRVLRGVDGKTFECQEVLHEGQTCPASVWKHCPRTCGRIERPLRVGTPRCFSPRRTIPLLKRYARWRWYSQGMQDSVLHMLLLRPDAAVPLAPDGNRFFVEFGYSWHYFSNSEYLRQLGWRGVRFDLNYSQPYSLLYAEEITAANVVEVFQRHSVPTEVDYVSIDIDSCDVWVFAALVSAHSPFRPRVVQIEYNRHFDFHQDVSLDCSSGGPPWGSHDNWPIKDFYPVNSNVYGASLRAISRVAASRGYSVVWVERCYDVFLVRDDLICNGDGLNGLDEFREFVARKGEERCGDGIEWFAHDVGPEYRSQWLREHQPK